MLACTELSCIHHLITFKEVQYELVLPPLDAQGQLLRKSLFKMQCSHGRLFSKNTFYRVHHIPFVFVPYLWDYLSYKSDALHCIANLPKIAEVFCWNRFTHLHRQGGHGDVDKVTCTEVLRRITDLPPCGLVDLTGSATKRKHTIAWKGFLDKTHSVALEPRWQSIQTFAR